MSMVAGEKQQRAHGDIVFARLLETMRHLDTQPAEDTSVKEAAKLTKAVEGQH